MLGLLILLGFPLAGAVAGWYGWRARAGCDLVRPWVSFGASCGLAWALYLPWITVHVAIIQVGLLGGGGGGPADLVFQIPALPGRWLAAALAAEPRSLLCGLCAEILFEPSLWLNLLFWSLVVQLMRWCRLRGRLARRVALVAPWRPGRPPGPLAPDEPRSGPGRDPS